MPALPPIADVLKVVFQGTVGDRDWVNVLHYQYSGGAPSSADLDGYAATLSSSWGSVMSPLQDTNTAQTVVQLTDLTSPTSGQGTTESTNPGTREGDFLPASTCMLINYPLSNRYRGGHPRTYLCVGVWADTESPQQWVSTFQSAVTTAWKTFTVDQVGVTVGPATIASIGAVSYRFEKAPRVTPVWFPYFSNQGTASLTMANMRRRTRKTARRR